MEQRKRNIIDKKFQLKTTYSFMGLFFFIIAVLIIMIGINYYSDNKKIEKIIEEQGSIMTAQSGIIDSMLQIVNSKVVDNIELASKLREKNRNNNDFMKKNIDSLKDLTRRNNVIFLIVIIFFILSGLILYPVLIRKTHKISGPIYLISEYIKEIMGGKFPELRPLRKKDELKEFYELFSRLVAFLKRQENGKD